MKAKNWIKSIILGAIMLPFGVSAQQVSIDTVMNHLREIASSRYEGRLAGTEGYMEAAQYVVECLARYGVQPLEDDWSQMFEIECNEIENCTFNTYVNQSDIRTPYVLGNDFVCAGMTGRGYADAPVVFVGYGIDAPSFNEYADVDAQGKIVLLLTGVPSFLPSSTTDKYLTLRDKARVAKKHGACAVVAINMSENCSPNEVQGKIYSGALPHLATFPIIQPHKGCGSVLLADEKMTLSDAVNKINESHNPQSFHLRKRFEIDVNAKYHPKALTGNVVGIYPGANSKLKDEYVVVGAHLDHLGMQGRTCHFPGANDNASGVAAMLEVARMLQLAEEQPERSVVFVAFSGAESQHLGSQIFISNFPKLKRIEAFVNAESIGCGDSILALGDNQFPILWNLTREQDSIWTNKLAAPYKTNVKGDAMAFAQIGIPSVVICALNGDKHPHQPSDIPENINREFLKNATTLLFQTVYEISFGRYQGRTSASRKVMFR